jgi:hypothetical protein
VVSHQSEWIANSLKERDMTRSSSATKRQGGKRKPAVSKANPEFVAFLAGLFGQMSHAADLVIAFFRQHGMLNGSGLAPVPMPTEFLLELAALLQFREWHQAGVIPWNDADGLTINDLIADAVGRLGDDPSAVQSEGRGMQSMVDMLRRWNETCAPLSREHLDGDIAVHWDRQLNIEMAVQSFADFLCRHRRAGSYQE